MPHIRQVYDSLQKIDAALAALRELTLQERQDIVGINLTGLSQHREEIDRQLAHIGDLNAQVSVQIAAACDACGLVGEKSLSQLITVVPKPDRDMYARLQKTVRADSASIKNELAINKALLQDSLAFTNYSLQTFTSILKANSGNSTYGKQGRFVDAIDQPRIICKEI
jgi:hypothetical protein